VKPYYGDGTVTIYHGDALDALPLIERGSVSAVVTDPPYVIGAVSAGNMASKSGGWTDMMNSAGWRREVHPARAGRCRVGARTGR
jgi:DNA modification methylase